MYEYEINVTVEDDEKQQHTIKKYLVCPIAAKPLLKEYLDKTLKKDKEISKYKLIKYNVLNYEID